MTDQEDEIVEVGRAILEHRRTQAAVLAELLSRRDAWFLARIAAGLSAARVAAEAQYALRSAGFTADEIDRMGVSQSRVRLAVVKASKGQG